ncbi:MAG: DUF2061 domain-containing protein [Hyphomonadaceae bacterium]|jgi:hypothetical protein|nr:DUF2061 domain-containing protein [Hyphomonadaceae bacterium]
MAASAASRPEARASRFSLQQPISKASTSPFDRRIALGVGVIGPMVRTVAYMLHEKAWSIGGRTQV